MDEDERFEGLGDEDFGDAVIDGELPPFWKPEDEGDKRIGEVTAIRKTKDFGRGPGEAIQLRGPEGMFSLPIGAGLSEVCWRRQVGRIFHFIFKGWVDLTDGKRVRKFIVRPKKGDGIPF
jgi:hypothetical protein